MFLKYSISNIGDDKKRLSNDAEWLAASRMKMFNTMLAHQSFDSPYCFVRRNPWHAVLFYCNAIQLWCLYVSLFARTIESVCFSPTKPIITDYDYDDNVCTFYPSAENGFIIFLAHQQLMCYFLWIYTERGLRVVFSFWQMSHGYILRTKAVFNMLKMKCSLTLSKFCNL